MSFWLCGVQDVHAVILRLLNTTLQQQQLSEFFFVIRLIFCELIGDIGLVGIVVVVHVQYSKF
jgi:hypothetical protein